MKRILHTSQNEEVEHDRQSRRVKCRSKPASYLLSDTQKADGNGARWSRTEDLSESDASDSDKDKTEESNGFIGGIMSSRVCKSRIPRWRMRKFLFISFNKEDPNPAFLGCPEWSKPMLTVYYQVHNQIVFVEPPEFAVDAYR
jgi:hypothetical protein